MPSTELLWFKIPVIIISLFTIGVCIPNLIYYNKLRNGTSKDISSGTALTMFWVNLILLILAVMVLVLSILALILHEKCRYSDVRSMLPSGTTHIAYTHTGQHVMLPQNGTQQFILPSGPVMGEATSTGVSANVLVPGQASSLAQQVQYY